MRVLVIASHPDDEVLGAGGTIARLAAEGHEVHIHILGEGIGARSGTLGRLQTPEVQQLKETSIKVAEFLGAQWDGVHKFPDNQFDTVSLLELAQDISSMVEWCKPQVVYTQHGGDLNRDHQLTYHATMIATRPMMGAPVKEVYAYEVASSTEWAFGIEPAFRPNTFVDIAGEHLERKIKAMEMYETERRPFPHPRSPEALRALAMWRGAQSGCMAAEAFQLVRAVR